MFTDDIDHQLVNVFHREPIDLDKHPKVVQTSDGLTGRVTIGQQVTVAVQWHLTGHKQLRADHVGVAIRRGLGQPGLNLGVVHGHSLGPNLFALGYDEPILLLPISTLSAASPPLSHSSPSTRVVLAARSVYASLSASSAAWLVGTSELDLAASVA